MFLTCFSDDAMADGGDHSNLSLSEVLAGAGADDPTFQQLARCGNILEGLEFPGDSLLPATPPRHRAGATTVNLPSPTAVSGNRFLIHVRCTYDVYT